MANYELSTHFDRFLSNINPPVSYERIAASEQANVTRLLESRTGPAAVLSPRCFLQGSYRQDTAIHSINDVDVVALCDLYSPGSGTGQGYSRDAIFRLLASALETDHRYRGKIRYHSQSLCIKIDLSIKVEILPAVKPQGISDPQHEPFKIFRPERRAWVDAFARYHQALLTARNALLPHFKPLIKTLKHLREIHGVGASHAVSFHLEGLLYRLAPSSSRAPFADLLATVLSRIAAFEPLQALLSGLKSPCGDKLLFATDEWAITSYARFHAFAKNWAVLAHLANAAPSPDLAIDAWKRLLGDAYFPRAV